jgi:ATP-dependent helicase/nuclease subunit A
MTPTADFEARERFVRETNHNFSVIASAGSGKTRAITDRIVAIAKGSDALEILPKLVVVTYTNRAANEMQQRSRARIVEAHLSLEVIEAFNRAFFGTIHSFCVKLLTAYGHHLGLPVNLELVTDDDDLWNQFVQQQTVIGRGLSAENRRVLLRHIQVRDLMELARRYEFELTGSEPDCACPDADFSQVYAAIAKGNSLRTIPRAKAELRRWEERWRDTTEFVPWPLSACKARDFLDRWREAFAPLRQWVNACALCVAAEVKRDYREFRMERATLTYADQIELAAELLRRPEVAARIRERGYRVILDEAQDTDPQQFFVLLEVTREPEAVGFWNKESDDLPLPGRFCMVGDLQQSIYRDPADLAHYRRLHDDLVDSHAAEGLKFSVTFRLDTAQLAFVNETFRHILNNDEGQVEFVQLNPRPKILPGQVVRVPLGGEINLDDPEPKRARLEAVELAEWIAATGLEKLRATSWREVAILCPRKAWLQSLRDSLLAVGLPVEIQSETQWKAENPAYAWVTALAAIMIDPHDAYEIVGVLREIFGLSDDELARFADYDGSRFQIASPSRGRGVVEQALAQLSRTRKAIQGQPLFSSLREIVRTTQLRERLISLPVQDFPNLEDDLNALLTSAAEAEAKGRTLQDFDRDLRRNFTATRETHPLTADAIQLITAHKAKGSEWQVVIVPFLSRQVRMATPRYPRIVRLPQDNQCRIVFDRTDIADFETELERSDRQEMERLLYVALTRAKHTLVLAADEPFFATAAGKVYSDTQTSWLRSEAGGLNHEAVSSFEADASACELTADEQSGTAPVESREDYPALSTGWLADARQNASEFLRVTRPSQFSPEEEMAASASFDSWVEVQPELQPPPIDNPATRYGVWWHELTEQIDWTSERASWDEWFRQRQSVSPDPARSQREWDLLCRHLESDESFRRLLPNDITTRTEMPFALRVDKSNALEGVVDLALFSAGKKRCFILDWKTDRISPISRDSNPLPSATRSLLAGDHRHDRTFGSRRNLFDCRR